MLSHQEQLRLREIERVLATTDPRLAHALRTTLPDGARPRLWPWRVLWICGATVAFIGSLAVNFPLVLVGLSWVGVGLIMVGHVRRRRVRRSQRELGLGD